MGERQPFACPAKLARLPRAGTIPVPWVALWSAEEGTAYLAPELALGQCHVAVFHREAVGEGRARLGRMSQVRQRRAILDRRCQVCGQPATRRYVVPELARQHVKLYGVDRRVLIEPPTCATCARIALEACPALRGRRFVELLEDEQILQFVAPIGDPSKDEMFDPLARADFPSQGAVGYIKYAILKTREATL